MKKYSILLMMVAILLLGAVTASAEVLSAAAQAEIRQTTGYDILNLNDPEGKASSLYPPNQWSVVSPEYFYADSSQQLMYFRASGTTYNFSLTVNQIAVANCLTGGGALYVYVSGSFISRVGCVAK